MLGETERTLLDRVITAEESGEWAGDQKHHERGRQFLDALAANFPAGAPLRDATADALGCLLEMTEQPISIERIRRCVDSLFVNGAGRRAARLVLTSADGRDLGGLCQGVVVDRLARALSRDGNVRLARPTGG